MIEFPESISFWHWLAFGVAVMLVEVLVPGVIFLWLGIAAVITGPPACRHPLDGLGDTGHPVRRPLGRGDLHRTPGGVRPPPGPRPTIRPSTGAAET